MITWVYIDTISYHMMQWLQLYHAFNYRIPIRGILINESQNGNIPLVVMFSIMKEPRWVYKITTSKANCSRHATNFESTGYSWVLRRKYTGSKTVSSIGHSQGFVNSWRPGDAHMWWWAEPSLAQIMAWRQNLCHPERAICTPPLSSF